MDLLAHAVETWVGPEGFRLLLAERGYGSAQKYIDLVAAFYDPEKNQKELCEYFNLIAKYNLAILTGSNLVKMPLRPKCLDNFNDQAYVGASSYYQKMRHKIEIEKLEEFTRLNFSLHEWSGERKGILQFISDAAGRHGFYPCNVKILRNENSHLSQNGYAKKSQSGLIFYFGFDSKGRSPISKLPLEFYMYHEKHPNKHLWLGDLRSILPGAEEYSLFGYLVFSGEKVTKIVTSYESAVLGIYALVELFGIFIESIGGGPALAKNLL